MDRCVLVLRGRRATWSVELLDQLDAQQADPVAAAAAGGR